LSKKRYDEMKRSLQNQANDNSTDLMIKLWKMYGNLIEKFLT